MIGKIVLEKDSRDTRQREFDFDARPFALDHVTPLGPPIQLLPQRTRAGAISVAEGRIARDQVLDALDERRAEVLARLRREAWDVWEQTHEPVTVNDVRHLLAIMAYEGDPRVLGAVFHRSRWTPVAFSQTNQKGNHGRMIRGFVPKQTHTEG